MREERIVRVGSKPKTDYVSAVLFALDEFHETKIEGLGNRQSKVLEIAETVAKINGVEIRAVNPIQVGDTNGLEIVIEKVGVGDNE